MVTLRVTSPGLLGVALAMLLSACAAEASDPAVDDPTSTVPAVTGATSLPPQTTTTATPTTAGTATATTAPVTTLGPVGSGSFDSPPRLEVLGHLELGPGVTDVWGHVAADGREYALVGSRVGWEGEATLYVVDVTDPTDPVEVSRVEGVAAFDVKMWGDYALATDERADHGVVVDLADPTSPRVVGSMPDAHNVYLGEDGQVFLANHTRGSIYRMEEGGIEPVPFIEEYLAFHDAVAVDGLLYLFRGYASTDVFDLSGPARPQYQLSLDHPLITYHHSGWPTSDGTHLLITDEYARGARPDITVWDLTGSGEMVGWFNDPQGSAHNLQVRGDHAFVSYYHAGMRVLDVSDPARLRAVAAFDPVPGSTEGWTAADYGGFGVYAFAPSGNVYFSGQEGLYVLGFNPPLPRPELR